MSDEQELLQRASKLNTQALAKIYDTYSPGIYRYAMRLLGDMSEAVNHNRTKRAPRR